MKQALFTALLASSFAGAPALAGSLNDPIVAEPVIAAETEGSSSGAAVVTILTIAMMLPALQ